MQSAEAGRPRIGQAHAMLLLSLLGCPLGADDKDPGDTSETGSPACSTLDPGDRLDLQEACVDGACAGSDYPTFRAAWGEPDACGPSGSRASCTWGDRTVDFSDCDHDGAPDTEYLCDLFDQTILLSGAWDGASAEGLGLGVDAACWVEVLGPLPWRSGTNPEITVSVSPEAGPVEEISLDWDYSE
jgi:hypothetical protein